MPPRHSVAEEIGLGLDGRNHVEGDYDDIDLRIQGRYTSTYNHVSGSPLLYSLSANDCAEIAAQVLTETDDETEPELPASWADHDSDDEYPDTPTRSRRAAKENYVGHSAHNKGSNLTRGTIPMPNTGLLFSNGNGRVRPPNSVGSVFGTNGRTFEAPKTQKVGDAMMRGGGMECGSADLEDPDGDVFMGENLPPSTQPQSKPQAQPPSRPRRFFKPSGIRLAGTSDVRFPPSVLNNLTNLNTSWGPAGFGGFHIEGGVMKRGFGLSYGGWGGGVVAADGGRHQEEEAAEEEEELGRGRRRRGGVREEEVVDGAESD